MKYKSEVGYVLYIATCFIFALQHCSGESCSNRGDVRLQNGANKFEGRVEVCGSRSDSNRALIWKIVCNAGWDINEAMVVCRQLGFSGNLNPIPVLDGTFSDPSTQSIHTSYIIKRNFTCKGNERYLLLNCTHNDRNSSYCNDPDSRMKPAGVYCFGQTSERNKCNNSEIRLSNGTTLKNASGRVEVCLDGLWGTVCDHGWSENDANTVCRQLGYDHEKAIPTRGAYFGEGSGPIHLSMAFCGGDDTKLTNCPIDKSGMNGCDHSDDAGVICMGPSNCSDGDIQLAGGKNEREGRVEICYNGVWGTVCADNGWDEMGANIVCQHLGFANSSVLPTNDSHFGAGDGLVQLSNVSCTKEHLSWSVNFAFIGAHHRCKYIAGVICMDNFMTSTSAPTTACHGTTIKYTCTSRNSTPTVSGRSGNSVSSVIYGAISGVLVITGIIIAALATVVTVVMILRRKRVKQTENSEKKSSMDNPTYDENISTTATQSRIISNEEDERLFQNPLYSDVGHCSSKNSYHPYEDTPNGRDVVSESSYSALDHSTEYFTLEPHIPKSYQEQLQPSDDDYSQLHHK